MALVCGDRELPRQVFQSKGDASRAAACNDQVVKIWSAVLCQVVLGVMKVCARESLWPTLCHTQGKRCPHPASPPACALLMTPQTPDGLVSVAGVPAELPVGRLQLMEVVDMLLDIGRTRVHLHGANHTSVADTHFVTCLALIQLEEAERAAEQLDAAGSIYSDSYDGQRSKLLDMARIMLGAIQQ